MFSENASCAAVAVDASRSVLTAVVTHGTTDLLREAILGTSCLF